MNHRINGTKVECKVVHDMDELEFVEVLMEPKWNVKVKRVTFRPLTFWY